MPWFDTPFWREYPFALPCFVAAAFALTFTVMAVYTVPEVGFSRLSFESEINIKRMQTLRKSESPNTDDFVKPKHKTSTWDALTGRACAILTSLFFMAFVSEIIFVT